MKYYPVFLNLKGRPVLLAGAGPIALQKLGNLLQCQARVHVVAPEALPEIRRLARDGKIKWSRRSYRTADMKRMALALAATDDASLQKRIAREARARGIWVNIVDVPPLCDFIAPAIVGRGNIQIAISTGGAAPALARHLRQKVESIIGPEYADFAAVIGKMRPVILKLSKERRASFWECVVSDHFMKDIRKHGIARAEKLLKEWIHAD
jgi:precorrin-2 dehydrogenase/sirohydrochlorin ferrochelatase